jgi:GNAT superfamily N-acetyltransferase
MSGSTSMAATVVEYLADHRGLIPELARMHFDEWGYLRPDETLAEREKRLGGCCNRNNIPIAMVALTEGRLSGSAMLVECDMSSRPDLGPWLAGIYVVPALRGRGLGTRLIARMEREAAGQGTRTLFLYTPATESMYASLGWSVLERREYQGTMVAVMHKNLFD